MTVYHIRLYFNIFKTLWSINLHMSITDMHAKNAILSAVALVGVFVSLFGPVAYICGLIIISLANISILTLAIKLAEPDVVHDIENPPL